VLYEQRVQQVQLTGPRVRRVEFGHAPPDEWGVPAASCHAEKGQSVAAQVFVDASYEGDLLAAAGVSYRTGREAAAEFGESFAGNQAPTNWTPIDPYIVAGSPESGLLPMVELDHGLPYGSADPYTQAYNFRVYLTNDSANRVLLTTPANYDSSQFELVGRYVEHLVRSSSAEPELLERLSWIFPGWLNEGEYNYQRQSLITMAPLGVSRAYQDGDWATRAEIWRHHVDYLRGLHRFLTTDPRIPQTFRSSTAAIGLDRRMHHDTAGWPHQLYVRITRRLNGRYTLTESDVLNRTTVDDGIGLALYGIDIYPVRRIACTNAETGQLGVATEGDMFVGSGAGTGIPYPVPYRAITPRRAECENLLVPVCFSATHVAYASARMEPVFSVLGESAGVAAAMAARQQTPVQDLDVQTLRATLGKRGQKLAWNPGRQLADKAG
jgi:hypothetical protein